MTKEDLYQPLPDPQRSIRLLCIEPGWPSESIRAGYLVVHDRKTAPQYDALSYVWGHAMDPIPITFNGLTKQVTANLSSALRAFRPIPTEGDPYNHGVLVTERRDILHSSRNAWKDFARNRNEIDVDGRAQPRLFWVDALCINQDDVDERSEQVKGMKEIFSLAQTVRIWFGEELEPRELSKGSSSLLDKLFQRIRLAEYGEMPVVLSFISQALRSISAESWDTDWLGFPDVDQPEWLILRKFFQQQWFHRVWTVQEAAVAKKGLVTVGDWEVDWDAVCKAAIWFTNSSWNLSVDTKAKKSGVFDFFSGRNGPDNIRPGISIGDAAYMASGRIRTEGFSLYEWLKGSRARAASLPVDHVFAVLELAREFNDVPPESLSSGQQEGDSICRRTCQEYSLLRADYKKTAAEVFRSTAIFMLRYHGSLDFLTEVELSETRAVLACPSWVPNWSVPRKSFPLAPMALYQETQVGEKNVYAAGTTQDIEYSLGEDQNILFLSGLKYDTVSSATQPLKTSFSLGNAVVQFGPTTEHIEFVSAAWSLCQHLVGDEEIEDSSSTADPSTARSEGGDDPFTMVPAPYRTSADILISFSHTLTGVSNLDPDKKIGLGWLVRCLGDEIYRASGMSKFKHRLTRALLRDSNDDDQFSFQNAMAPTCSWRRFFITRNRHMGVGPMSMEEGDEILVIFGLRVPLVVRPHTSSRHEGQRRHYYYSVVGECYIPGIMNGQVTERWKCSTDRLGERFCLA